NEAMQRGAATEIQSMGHIRIRRTVTMRAFVRWATCLAVCCFGLANCRADTTPSPELDPKLPYQMARGNPVTYDVDFSVVVTPPYHAKVLKVWLPLPQTDAGQEVT